MIKSHSYEIIISEEIKHIMKQYKEVVHPILHKSKEKQ